MYLPAGERPGPLVPQLAVLTTNEIIDITMHGTSNSVYKAASELRGQLESVTEIEPTTPPTSPTDVWTTPL